MKTFKKPMNWRHLIFTLVLVTLVASIIYISIAMALAPTETDETGVRVKGDYVLMLAQCILGVFALNLPSILDKKIQLEIPSNMLLIYAVFLY